MLWLLVAINIAALITIAKLRTTNRKLQTQLATSRKFVGNLTQTEARVLSIARHPTSGKFGELIIDTIMKQNLVPNKPPYDWAKDR